MKKEFFKPAHSYQQHGPYEILPFRFMRWSGAEVFLSNDVGEWLFLSSDEFQAFTGHSLLASSSAFQALQAKHFLAQGDLSVPLQLLATKYRTKKAFLDGFTRLHIFVVTLRCDHSCPYCQVSRVTSDRVSFDMSEATARKAVDAMFRSPAPGLKVEFQGGESLANFDLIKSIVGFVKERNAVEKREIEYVVATNLSELSEEVLNFCETNNVYLSTSLDGPESLHNQNRPRPNRDSHQRLVANIERARQRLGRGQVSALMTTTAESLEHSPEIVDEYVQLGFDAIFLRPISPYGFAIRSGSANRYNMQAFESFYLQAFERIIEWNRSGTAIVESYAQLLLRKLLTPFATGYVDLQSPAGCGISAVVYNYDGKVYASDEGRMLAEMRDQSFCLGDLHQDQYSDIFGGERLRALVEHSCSEVLPGCSECAFLPFCGADPTFHWATQGDMIGHRPTSAFCARNMFALKYLVGLLRSGDDFTQRLLTRWAVSQS